MSNQLWRVYTYTEGDECVSERIVAADCVGTAQALAIGNVRAQNSGKGCSTDQESRAVTKVLAIKKAGKDGVLTINRFPVAIVRDWGLSK